MHKNLPAQMYSLPVFKNFHTHCGFAAMFNLEKIKSRNQEKVLHLHCNDSFLID